MEELKNKNRVKYGVDIMHIFYCLVFVDMLMKGKHEFNMKCSFLNVSVKKI
jgi:hypothetical protein